MLNIVNLLITEANNSFLFKDYAIKAPIIKSEVLIPPISPRIVKYVYTLLMYYIL